MYAYSPTIYKSLRVDDDRCRKRKGKWTDVYAHKLIHIIVWGCIQLVDWTGLVLEKVTVVTTADTLKCSTRVRTCPKTPFMPGKGRHFRKMPQYIVHE